MNHLDRTINTDSSLESVAEYTKRPLLSITAADLGHEPIVLEKNLLRFFKDASNWDAIVLLDEADVYLERRSVNDLRRNSIVSSKPTPSGFKNKDANNSPPTKYSYAQWSTFRGSYF